MLWLYGCPYFSRGWHTWKALLWLIKHIFIYIYWLVVSTPLKNINQLGWLFPIYGKIKMFQITNQYIYNMISDDWTEFRKTWVGGFHQQKWGPFFLGQPWSAQNSGIPTKNRGIIPSFGVDGERHVILPLTLDFRRFVLAVESRNSPSNSDSFNRQNDDKTWDLAMEYSGYDIYIYTYIYISIWERKK